MHITKRYSEHSSPREVAPASGRGSWRHKQALLHAEVGRLREIPPVARPDAAGEARNAAPSYRRLHPDAR